MVDNSPVYVATAVARPRLRPDFAEDLLRARSPGRPPEQFQKYLTTKDLDGYSIANIEWSERGCDEVTISKDGNFATII
jgi:hypothetical protein